MKKIHDQLLGAVFESLLITAYIRAIFNFQRDQHPLYHSDPTMRISSISPLGLHSTPFSMNSVDSQNLWPTLAIPILLGYFLLVRLFRYRRADFISSVFGPGKRPLSSMTTQEAFSIMQQLQQLEFPHAMNKARTIALLKVCHECIESRIPRAKLFSRPAASLQCPSYLLSLGRTQGRTQENVPWIQKY